MDANFLLIKSRGCFQTVLCVAVSLISLSSTGCIGSAMQKSVDRAIAIEKSCTSIQTALPLQEVRLKETFVETVALRLVGTCLDGAQTCLNAPGQAQLPKDVKVRVVSAFEGTRQSLAKIKTSASVQWHGELKSMAESYITEMKDLETREKQIGIETEKLLNYLMGLKKQIPQKTTCAERETCVIEFGKLLQTAKPKLYELIKDLQLAVNNLPISDVVFSDIVKKTDVVLSDKKMAGVTVDMSLLKNSLFADHAELKRSAEQLDTRIKNGLQAINRLASDDVRLAASELLVDKISAKAAERILSLVDNMLQQLDHTIDKLDQHAYGGATVLTYLYSGDMQDQFDKIYEELVVKKFKDQTARIVFANAACQRLGVGADAASSVRNNSMFMPFLLAAMTRLETELIGETPDGTPEQQAKLATAVTIAREKDIDRNRAPSVQQKTALCVAVEQQLGVGTNSTKGDVHIEANEICAENATMAAVAGKPIVNSASPNVVEESIKKFNHENHVAVSAELAVAAAWSAVMDKVLASNLRQPMAQELSCGRFALRFKDAGCEEARGGVILSFNAPFASGKHVDRALEMQLASLADVLNVQAQPYQVLVVGYSSRARFLCAKKTVTPAVTCIDAQNQKLAGARAAWAKSVLQGRIAPARHPTMHSEGIDNPLSFDTPADRNIRVSIWPVGNDTSSKSTAVVP